MSIGINKSGIHAYYFRMLSSLRALFGSGTRPAPDADSSHKVDPLHLAACVLLLDIAWADGEFVDEERTHLEEILTRHFGLEEQEANSLLQLAERERKSAIDHFSFTSVVKQNYDMGQRILLAEAMWGLVLSDGSISQHEHYLARKIANFLDLEPAYLARAKQAAEQKGELRNEGK